MNVGIGLTDADTPLEVLSTSTQQKWSYDNDSFATITVSNNSHTTLTTGESGNLTLTTGPSGDVILSPTGSVLLKPSTGNVTIYNSDNNNIFGSLLVKNDQQLYWSEGGNEYKLSANTGSSGGNSGGEPIEILGTDIDVWALS